ncbi:hypothetical protein BS47DRAFT_1484802 [Hydnum rufescens UP504]|uniref:mRNA export factor MEX67 n=1 Tax=Hydnum rufescens UP504 TaxID=1448309 RepID=A0A9P6AZX4_9AGAM|nr:hypothetical protein BS47DRAFT_1484802 [Hydnum rufescens UP504]
MFSNPSSAASSSTSTPHRAVASTALRSAGLIEEDVHMRDAPGGVKRTNRARPARQRPTMERMSRMERDATAAKQINLPILGIPRLPYNQIANRTKGPVAIKGAATSGTLASRLSASASASQTLGRSLRARAHGRSQDSSGSKDAAPTAKSVEVLREFVQKRWNAQAQFLNLERMAEDEILKKYKIPPPDSPSALKMIASLSYIQHYLPHLANLSLENNQIKTMRDLDGLTSNKSSKSAVSEIKELVLKGNPIYQQAAARGDLDKYRSEISRRFPMLEMLDQEPVARIGFDIPLSVLTDRTCRSSLAPAYAPNATFSISANTSIPLRAKKRGLNHSLPNQRLLKWTWYFSKSRNLSRVRSLDQATETLHAGTGDIMAIFRDIPETKHDIAQQDKFVVDAWPMPGILRGEPGSGDVLFISVHGEFAEGPDWGLRSFDRSFILALAPDSSPAKLAGWPCVIISDQLVVRGYSGSEAWRPGPLLVGSLESSGSRAPPFPLPPLQSNPQPPVIDPVLTAIPEPQRSLVMQISARTGLNISFSAQCLEGNGWDMQRAIANFEAVKGTIPPEAFVR